MTVHMSEVENKLLRPIGSEPDQTEAQVTIKQPTVTDVLCQSLRDEPYSWNFDDERATHKNGTRIRYYYPERVYIQDPFITLDVGDQKRLYDVVSACYQTHQEKLRKEAHKSLLAKFGH